MVTGRWPNLSWPKFSWRSVLCATLSGMWRLRPKHHVLRALAGIGLVACSVRGEVTPADAHSLAGILEAVEAAPVRAGELCAALMTPAIRHDCMLHGVEHLARRDPDTAAGICARIPAGIDADECFFQVAERSREPVRCADDTFVSAYLLRAAIVQFVYVMCRT